MGIAIALPPQFLPKRKLLTNVSSKNFSYNLLKERLNNFGLVNWRDLKFQLYIPILLLCCLVRFNFPPRFLRPNFSSCTRLNFSLESNFHALLNPWLWADSLSGFSSFQQQQYKKRKKKEERFNMLDATKYQHLCLKIRQLENNLCIPYFYPSKPRTQLLKMSTRDICVCTLFTREMQYSWRICSSHFHHLQ